MPELTAEERKLFDSFATAPFDESYGALVAKYDLALRLVRQAGQMKVRCEWGVDIDDGPEALLILVRSRPVPNGTLAPPAAESSARVELAPHFPDSSLMAYHRAAGKSWDEPDAVLAREALRLLPPNRGDTLTFRGPLASLPD